MYGVWNQRPAAARSEVHRWDIPWRKRLTGNRLFLSAEGQRTCEWGGLDKQLTAALPVCSFKFQKLHEAPWIFSSRGERAEYISFNQKFLFLQQVKLQMEIWNKSLSLCLSPCNSLCCLRFPARQKLQSLEHSSHVFLSQKESHANLSFTPNHKKYVGDVLENVVRYSTAHVSPLCFIFSSSIILYIIQKKSQATEGTWKDAKCALSY